MRQAERGGVLKPVFEKWSLFTCLSHQNMPEHSNIDPLKLLLKRTNERKLKISQVDTWHRFYLNNLEYNYLRVKFL